MDEQLTPLRPRLHFKNPPIVEAVIGIDVAVMAESFLDQLNQLTEKMADIGYQAPVPVVQGNFLINIDAKGSSANVSQSPLGWQFSSTDNLHLVKFNRSGFVFSRLGHYDSWEGFRGEGRKLWKLYLEAIGTPTLQGYGVRYVNKLFIPISAKIDEYLKVYPWLPDDVPQTIDECIMRLSMRLPTGDGRVIHQQVLAQQEKPDFATLIFDNDFRFSALGMTDDTLWEQIEEARDIKDDYFCKFLTPKMLETFDV
jgi:uncharacterized protein (TIGR04255 family)